MKNKIIISITVFLASAITASYFITVSKSPKHSQEKIEFVSRQDLQNFWIKMLNEKNPDLHDAVIAAMLLSKDSGKEIYVLHNSKTNALGFPNRLKYRISTERGAANNILSFDYSTKYISFDHFNSNDGPIIEHVYNKIIVDRKISSYYSELGIK